MLDLSAELTVFPDGFQLRLVNCRYGRWKCIINFSLRHEKWHATADALLEVVPSLVGMLEIVTKVIDIPP
jgi:hypothetical protein